MQRGIFIIDDPTNDIDTDFVNAFKSKAGRSEKPISDDRDRRFNKPLKQYMLHQIHEHNTWIIDEVQFKEFLYVFFVEANTRYLIIVQGSSDTITANAYEQDGSEKQISGQSFFEAFNQFVKVNRKLPTHIILDSALAHDYKPFRARCVQGNVVVEKVLAKDNHYSLSILDRCVNTIRGMCEKLGFTGTPPEMIRVASIYNNTQHTTLSKAIGKPTTPSDLHNNEELEKRFLLALRKQNFITQHKKGFTIDVGSKVVVRAPALANPFEKRHKTVLAGTWFVVDCAGNRYVVENTETKERRNVMRRDLRST